MEGEASCNFILGGQGGGPHHKDPEGRVVPCSRVRSPMISLVMVLQVSAWGRVGCDCEQGWEVPWVRGPVLQAWCLGLGLSQS